MLAEIIMSATVASTLVVIFGCYRNMIKLREIRIGYQKRAVQADLELERLRGLSVAYARQEARVEVLSGCLRDIIRGSTGCRAVDAKKVSGLARHGLEMAGLEVAE